MTRKTVDSGYVSAMQASKILGVNRATVINWARQGRIKGIQYGEHGIYRFLREDIERFLADSRLPSKGKRLDGID